MFCLYTRMCIMCMLGALKRPKEGTGFPRVSYEVQILVLYKSNSGS